ncbi:hypothetical protein TNIN_881 [Trichonephila inaurata madagascariensis]|uniref:Uncharacterized protein n=1 Tax=Trichonephila inaurata madagascariensis TaxID=2747483 RepID=A0A8X6YKI1_9ARAC|nr:hypothetical protein TNIN_881 [Trichonephila inaurata madagascariensis]
MIEDFNAIPSLRFLTGSWIVSTISNRGDIAHSIKRCFSNVHQAEFHRIWEETKMHATEIVQSIEDIPKVLVEYMKALINPIFHHMKAMRTFYNFTRNFNSVNLEFPVTYWTPYGTIDTKRHEELIALDERNDIGFRYSLACHNCFEEILQQLFPLLTDAQRINFRIMDNNRELLSYWTIVCQMICLPCPI